MGDASSVTGVTISVTFLFLSNSITRTGRGTDLIKL